MRPPVSLNSLASFEAAARHLSFTRAARELEVLQPAVSRQVIELEKTLGITLFERTKPLLTLTADGNMLYDAVASGLGRINETLDFFLARGHKKTVVVNATIGLASCYLMSRLADFEARFPEFQIELVTRDQNASFDPRSCDLVFVFDLSRNLGVKRFRLFEEEMICVCAGDYPDFDAGSLAGICAQPLLALATAQHRDDWKRFLASAGAGARPPQFAQQYLSFIVYLQAILDGHGLGIGWRYLLDEHLAAGRLRIAHAHVAPGERAYHCYLTERARENPAAVAFYRWAETLALENR